MDPLRACSLAKMAGIHREEPLAAAPGARVRSDGAEKIDL
jgi:hypothetical protein